MVSGKVLQNRPGLGPGSGVELNGQSVATMLLAVLSSEIRGDTVRRVKSLVNYKPVNANGRCTVTGATNLRDSIAIGLEKDGVWRSRHATLFQVALIRSENTVEISWRHSKGFQPQRFVGLQSPREPIYFKTALEEEILQSVIAEIRERMPGTKQGIGA